MNDSTCMSPGSASIIPLATHHSSRAAKQQSQKARKLESQKARKPESQKARKVRVGILVYFGKICVAETLEHFLALRYYAVSELFVKEIIIATEHF